uniref:Tumor protein p53-inducible protein 13 n=1 Tax=Leptobrachium leishanense TaxID=445787 RepID=A0A8C5PPK1_9ANUR
MWRLCFRFFLLLCPGTGARALCDNGRFNIHVDLPEEAAYVCLEALWPFPSKNFSHTCIDTQIVYTSPIPNSGAHRPKAAKYGEYIYCPPQRWLHNLKHGGVAFLYHPCVHPHLKGELSWVARSCMYKHILTPLRSLSIERPLALAAWGSSLEMSHIDLKAVKEWLQVNIFRDHENKIENVLLYDYLLLQPSTMVSDQEDTEICPESPLQVLEITTNKRRWLKKTQLRKRRAASAVHSFKQRATSIDFHHGERPLHSVPSEAQTVANVKFHNPVPPALKTDTDNMPSPVLSVNVTSPSPGAVQPGEDTDNSIRASPINKRDGDVVPEPEFQRNLNSSTNNAKDSSNSSLDSFSAEHFKNMLEKGGNIKKNLLAPKNQEYNSPKSQQDTEHRNYTVRKTQVTSSENLAPKQNGNPVVSAPTSGPDLSSNNKRKCQQEPTANLPPKAHARSGPGHRRKLDVYSSTPRTEEATWAAASLIFLLVLLTVCVLYTQIHKKFQKSQSLYWRSGSTCFETESVATVIKRRLKEGYSKRKKWIGRKKPPVLLYDSLSESSD